MSYTIRRADVSDVLIATAIRELALECFPKGTLGRKWSTAEGVWWLAWRGKEVVGFSGVKTFKGGNCAYIALQGVLPRHRGHSLQRRFTKLAERYARERGCEWLVTETILDNPHSGNNMIRAGMKLFTPDVPWNPKQPALYWRKAIA